MKDLHEPCHLSLIDSNYDTNKMSWLKKKKKKKIFFHNNNGEKSTPSDTSDNEIT